MCRVGEYLPNVAGTQRRYLAALVCEVAKAKPRLKDWIDYDAVIKESVDNETETKERVDAKDAAEAHLRDWKLSKGYQLTRDDYSGVKEIEEQILAHEAVLTSEDEVRYLEREMENKDSWYNACVCDQNRFTFYRKLETLAANKDFADYFSKYIIGMYLANFGPTKFKSRTTIEYMVQTQERFLDRIHEIIEHGKVSFPDLVQNKGKWFFVEIDRETRLPFIDYELKETGRITGRTSFNTMKYREAKRKWNVAVNKALPALQAILVAIETVNLVNSLKTAKQTGNETGFAAINVLGSIADCAGSLQHLGEKRAATLYQKYKGGDTAIAENVAKKTFAWVNLVGAVSDYIGAINDTVESSAKGYNRTAAGYAVIALAAVASGASAAVTLSGAAIFGLTAGPLGVIGIALFIAGSGIVWYFSDEELLNWAEHCIWTKSYDSIYPLSTQIYTLHEILCVFSSSCYLYATKTRVYLPARDLPEDYDYWFTVSIRPGYLNEQKSKYRVTLSLYKKLLSGNDTMVFYRTVLLPDKKTDRVPFDPTQPLQRLIRRFSPGEVGLPDDFYKEKYRYELTAKLDFDGDGNIDFPSEGKIIKGDIVLTGNDY
jgi:hypothetical protein